MGASRVATYDGTKIRWLIGDHLGSTSTVLNETAVMVERIDYNAWGELKNYEKFGAGSEVAWFYFTGKKVDEESGLVFFGGRYYVPKISRWLTADPTIAHPYDPQDLNRYTYCRNNPVNLVDPTGYSWKKFFKAVVDNVKYLINPVNTNPILNGIVTGDWSYARDMAIAGATGFVFGGPMGAAVAMATTATMRTPTAQWATQETGHYVFDNMLGMRPRTADIWASTTLSIGVSLGYEKAFASASGAQPAKVRDMTDSEVKNMRVKGKYAGDEEMYGRSLSTPNSFQVKGSVIKGLERNGELIGSYQSSDIGILATRHSSSNMLSGVKGATISPNSYAIWGTCHQATNVTLLQGGVSSTVINLEGNWSMYATTAVYGNYGGQLGHRITSGVDAYNNVEERN